MCIAMVDCLNCCSIVKMCWLIVNRGKWRDQLLIVKTFLGWIFANYKWDCFLAIRGKMCLNKITSVINYVTTASRKQVCPMTKCIIKWMASVWPPLYFILTIHFTIIILPYYCSVYALIWSYFLSILRRNQIKSFLDVCKLWTSCIKGQCSSNCSLFVPSLW